MVLVSLIIIGFCWHERVVPATALRELSEFVHGI
jgi:hypothetical protein